MYSQQSHMQIQKIWMQIKNTWRSKVAQLMDCGNIYLGRSPLNMYNALTIIMLATFVLFIDIL